MGRSGASTRRQTRAELPTEPTPPSSRSSSHRAVRPVPSESWDDDFDLIAPAKQAVVAPIPLQPRALTQWPNPSWSSGLDDDGPTITPANLQRSSGTVRQRQASSRHTSTGSSQSSQLPFGWRSSTPSLASDRGITTPTDSEELETESFDTETEGDERFGSRRSISRRRDDELPDELKGLALALGPPPLMHRASASSNRRERSRTASDQPDLPRPSQSTSQRRPGASTSTTRLSYSSSRSSQCGYADRSGVTHDSSGSGTEEDGSELDAEPQSSPSTSFAAGTNEPSQAIAAPKRRRRKLRRRRPGDGEDSEAFPAAMTRSQGSSTTRLPLLAPSPNPSTAPSRRSSIDGGRRDENDGEWTRVPFPPSPDKPQPSVASPPPRMHRRTESWTSRFAALSIAPGAATPGSRRRPLSFSLSREKVPTLPSPSAEATPSTVRPPRKLHKPSASVSSLGNSPALPSGFFSRARALSRPGKPLEPPVVPAASMPKSESVATIKASARTRPSDTFLRKLSADRQQSLSSSPSNATLLAPSSPVLGRTALVPLAALTPPTLRVRPMTAAPSSRPDSFYSGASTVGPSVSPAGSKRNSAILAPVRRVSMSDLRVPQRIATAQARIGQDLQRVRDFKSGIEELKELRSAYSKFLSSASPPDNDEPTFPSESIAKLEMGMRRIEGAYAVYWEAADVLVALAEGETDEPSRRERCVSMQPPPVHSGMTPDDADIVRSPTSIGRSSSAGVIPTSPSPSGRTDVSVSDRQLELLRGMLSPREDGVQPFSPRMLWSQPAASTSTPVPPLAVQRSSTAPSVPQTSPDRPRPDAAALDTPGRASIISSVASTPPASQRPGAGRLRQVSRASIVGIRDFLRGFRRSSFIGPASTSDSPQPAPAALVESPRPTLTVETAVASPCVANGDSDEDWDRSSSDEEGASATGSPVASRHRHRERTVSAASSALLSPTSTVAGAGGQRFALSTDNMPTLLEHLEHVRERCRTCLGELRTLTV